MQTIKNLFGSSPSYQALHDDSQTPTGDHDGDDLSSSTASFPRLANEPPLSRSTYTVFLLLGIAMLWAWNMFLAAAPYFALRFQSSVWIRSHFQPAEISVSCVAGLIAMLVLSNFQRTANYARRIIWALVINIVAFAVLAASTSISAGAEEYFAFLLIVILAASLSTGLIQNGVFSFAAGYGRKEYVQAIMTGQGIAGFLPPLVQILSVLAAGKETDEKEVGDAIGESGSSARIYFVTASAVSLLALATFIWLLRQSDRNDIPQGHKIDQEPSEGDYLAGQIPEIITKKTVSLWTLFKKTRYLALAVALTFAVTMLGFPVFTASITSVNNTSSAVFIPLAFLVWNLGDFTGRLATVFPSIALTHYPLALLVISIARLVFVPMYLLCNIRGRGAIVSSDAFYLLAVQFLFGISNGYVGSSCMMGAGEWVADDEKEAVGGFMGLMLVAGLTVGSLLSFAFGDI